MRRRMVWMLALAAIAAGCRGEEDSTASAAPAEAREAAGVADARADSIRAEEELEAVRAQMLARADSVRGLLLRGRGLSAAERRDLRRDVNARQLATARGMGVRGGSDAQIEQMLRDGRLVELEDSARYWVLRDLTHSVPYVTPDAKAMLIEVGRRFHERLDSLGIPRYRMEVTSVLRTASSQSSLRRSNSNAARGVSAHEFATTLDVAHMRFAAPESSSISIPSAAEHTGPMRYVEGLVLSEVAYKHAATLQGELGRVLREMRAEGKLRVMMETTQAVYHMTVARRYPRSALSG